MDRHMAEALDRHITGNHGEDSVPDEVVLSPEAFGSAEQMVDELTAIATAYGFAVDGRESTRPALLLTARTLVQILIPADPDAVERGGSR